MKPPAIPRSPRSSRSWPPLELELRGSPRLALAWACWCVALSVALMVGCELPAALRVPGWLLGALGLPGALWCGTRVLLGREARAIVRLRWESDGRWWVQERSGASAYVEPGVPRRLGPLFWLSWRQARRRHHLLIDGALMEPNAMRRLKARLRLSSPPAGHTEQR